MTDHAAEARRLLDLPTPAEADIVVLDLAEAQVHATLALVEQQRTANLIAQRAYLVGLVNGTGRSLSQLAKEEFSAIEVEVDARLGLTPTTPNQEQQL